MSPEIIGLRRPRFADPDDDAAFERDGYVVVDLVDAAGLEQLSSVFAALEPPGPVGFTASLQGRDLEENLVIADQILAVVGPGLHRTLTGFEVIGATFLTKTGGDEGAMEVHQDWNSVDERTDRSMNVWCTLRDIDLADGPLEVVPGSHLWFDAVRAPLVPSPTFAFDGQLEAGLVALELRAGQAVIYDHALLHGSRANRSGRPRTIAQVGITGVGAPLVMGFPAGDDQIELRSVPAVAFFDGLAFEVVSPDQRPGTVVEVMPNAPVTEAQVLARLGGDEHPAEAVPVEPAASAVAGRGTWWHRIRARRSRADRRGGHG